MTGKLQRDQKRSSKFFKTSWWIITAWTVIILGLLVRDLLILRETSRNLVIGEARAHFQRDEAFRFWAAKHGGFYVPIDERTPPNLYLSHIPERDIITPSGIKLTLMNPAYALRQMNEEFTTFSGMSGHITSLKPLRPENGPDQWEHGALKSFEKGKKEYLEYTMFNGESSLRLMRPLITQEGCLKCHRHQGYSVGDVRGGVSVSVPLQNYLSEESKSRTSHIFSFALIWMLGAGVIIRGSRAIRIKSLEKEYALEMLEISKKSLEIRVNERTKELSEINLELEAEINERQRTEADLTAAEKKYRVLFENMTSGFALHKIVLDDNNVPIDYIFIEVNNMFQDLTGLKKEKIVGKKVTDVIPGIENDPVGWIDLYGKVALTGEGVRFENFSAQLKKWYSVSAFSPGKEFVATLFEDITHRKDSEEEILRLKSSLEVQVAEKTNELNENVSELKGFFMKTMEREKRIKELRDRVSELEAELKNK